MNPGLEILLVAIAIGFLCTILGTPVLIFLYEYFFKQEATLSMRWGFGTILFIVGCGGTLAKSRE